MVTNVASLNFEFDGTYATSSLPKWVRIKLEINRTDDVSGVNAKSAGPDKTLNTDDDITSE